VCPVGGGYSTYFLFNNNDAGNCDDNRNNNRDDNRNDNRNDNRASVDDDYHSLDRATIWWHLHLLR
jgi:hypothetical protein